VHATIEPRHPVSGFDAQVFGSRADFFAKITTDQLWYRAVARWPARAPTPGVGVGKALSSCSPKKPLKLSPKTFLLHPLPLELLLTPKADHDVPGHPESWQESTELAVPNGRQAAHLSRQLGNGGV
jgi:hypothetical protein